MSERRPSMEQRDIRDRGPTYSKEEVRTLVNIVEKYKFTILNKSTNSTSNHAKEAAWNKICKEINKQGYDHTRNVDSLKMKWDNLKNKARKVSKNVMDVKNSELDDVLCQIVAMMNETDNTSSTEMLQKMNEEDESNSSKTWDDNNDKQSDDTDDDDDDDDNENKRLTHNRSLNFSPQESSLLLKCVRDEKQHIFNKECTARAIKMKNSAWGRVTYAFNKASPQKRNTKVLRTKFFNMRRMTRNVSFKSYFTKNEHEKLEEEDRKNVKKEPVFEYEVEMDTNNDNNDCIKSDNYADVHGGSNKTNDDMSDPLSTVLNGDSGIDSLSHFGSFSTSESKEITKLKLELLKYKLETAKLERHRIKEAVLAESIERQTKAVETSLRIRAARLEVVAAEMKLPPDHPALGYSEREDVGRQYLQEFSQSVPEIKMFN